MIYLKLKNDANLSPVEGLFRPSTYVHEPEGIEELMPWSDKMKELCAIDEKATIEDKDGNPKLLGNWLVCSTNVERSLRIYIAFTYLSIK